MPNTRRAFERAVVAEIPLLDGDGVPAEWMLDRADYLLQDLEDAEEAEDGYDSVIKLPPIELRFADDFKHDNKVGVLPWDVGTVHARALAGRAWARHMQDRDDEAIKDCRAAIRLWPNYAYPHWCLAQIHESRGDVRSAIDEFTVVRRLLPEAVADVELGLGHCWATLAKAVDGERAQTGTRGANLLSISVRSCA